MGHYSVNGLLKDDWSFVHLVHAAMHGHLTLGALWSQHNENRMFVPNVIMVTLAVATHDNTRTAMFVSALLFIGSYLCFLLVLQVYLRRQLTFVVVVASSVVWFSLADWQNALWGFQFAWYLIVFLLMVMLCLLIAVPVDRRGPLVFTAAVVTAALSCYSSAQGVFLWPLGLVCLLWPLQGDPRRWSQRARREVVVWCVATGAAIVIYFWGLQRGQTGFYSSTWRHPLPVLQSVLANIGDVFPTADPQVGVHDAIGSVLFLAAAFVVVRSFRERRTSAPSALPVVLILFALLFDPFVASNRLLFGVVLSLAPRYTMANLLLLLALITYVLGHLGSPARAPLRGRSRTAVVVIVMVTPVIAVQVAVSTDNGLHRAEATKESITLGNRIIVNLAQIPSDKAACYAFAGIEVNTGEVGDAAAIAQAEADHLSELSPGPDEAYRAEGLPKLAACVSP